MFNCHSQSSQEHFVSMHVVRSLWKINSRWRVIDRVGQFRCKHWTIYGRSYILPTKQYPDRQMRHCHNFSHFYESIHSNGFQWANKCPFSYIFKQLLQNKNCSRLQLDSNVDCQSIRQPPRRPL